MLLLSCNTEKNNFVFKLDKLSLRVFVNLEEIVCINGLVKYIGELFKDRRCLRLGKLSAVELIIL